jgi:hypothetical protein
MKKNLLSFIALLALAILSVATARADSITTEVVSARGLGPGPGGIGGASEDITGSFLFDSTTGVAYGFSLSGTGAVSETWNFAGPVAANSWACNPTSCFSLPPIPPGSLGDTLPFDIMIFPDGGFVEGAGALTGFMGDSWGGSVIATPEPTSLTFLAIGLAGLLAARSKSARRRRLPNEACPKYPQDAHPSRK